MGELDVTGESGGDDDFDADAEEAATESSRASVLFEYNIKGLQPQTKWVSCFNSVAYFITEKCKFVRAKLRENFCPAAASHSQPRQAGA